MALRYTDFVKKSRAPQADSRFATLPFAPLPFAPLLMSSSEASAWVKSWNIEILGARVDRVAVPACSEHPDGYFKKEWLIDFYHSQYGARQLWVSLRPQACGVLCLPAKTLKIASKATRSGFDLALAKAIEGRKLIGIQALEHDRKLILQFQSSNDQPLELELVLIPTKPSAQIVETPTPHIPASVTSASGKIPHRPERFEDREQVTEAWLLARRQAAWNLRLQQLHQKLEKRAQGIKRKLESLQQQLDQTLADPPWDLYGRLLQTHFHAQPKALLRDGTWVLELPDYAQIDDAGKPAVCIAPADPKLSLKQQLEKYFHLAKRNRLRLEDSKTRIDELKKELTLRTHQQQELQSLNTLSDLEAWMGIDPFWKLTGSNSADGDLNRDLSTPGKIHVSTEGLTIVCGRNAKENLEVTFKVAKGNDIWMHVRGRPGSHTVILLPPKRSASLETLLHAARLCVAYSGGKSWGKTEVDYTRRKHVKKIKNQTEVSYTQNKTLIVDASELKSID